MEHEIATRYATSPLSDLDLRLISEVKDAFQASWLKNQRPEIESFLEKLPASLKQAALAELVTLDIRFRRAEGGSCLLTDYTTRFPGYHETVSKLFDQLQAADTQPTCEATVIEASSEMEEHDPLNKKPEVDKRKSDGSDELKDVPEQFGRYRILRELGRGGMGAVFLALDGDLDRNVALKIPFFREDDEKEAVQRFYREAKAMAVVQHANLCPVYDVGRFGDWHFLTMAFIDGQPLSHLLKDSNFLSVTQAATLMKTVAVAVQKAHEAGIVHRDLKPANIMLNKDGDPIIMDFGLARRKSSGEADLTQTGAVFGSPAYMAPEQVEARHDEIGPATDVYALGVILYQMVTGHRPFQGSVASIFGQIVSKVPDPPSKLRQGLPPELDSICLKALAKSPLQRHASAAKFAEELSYLVNPAGNDVKTISYHSRPEDDSAAGAEAEST
ncbi:MAG: serine/threonine-protein kinase, partial [Schlesneria sp.]